MKTITRKATLSISTPIFLGLITGALLSPSAATMADDEKDCTEEMANLAACIPFVSGTAKQPTKECCDGTNKVKTAKPKCLCFLIKDSSDPSMGLPINTTLALQMPAACNIDAKVSDCPLLLNLPADSPDAKIFKEASSGYSSASNSSVSGASSMPVMSSDNTKTTSAVSSSSGNVVKMAPAGSSVLLLAMGLALIISFV